MDKRSRPSTNPALEQRIRELIAFKGGGHNEDLATRDIIAGEPFHIITPTPEEADDAEHLDLQRLAFGFNRHDNSPCDS
ncbi:MAG: hypothetical protein RL514_2826 [Verrucomicrobiota bacterium]|jgi:hypothetical protein